MSPQQSNMPRPISVVIVATLVMLEALAVLGYAISYLSNLSNDGVVNVGGQIFMLGLCLVAAVWQGSVAVNFFKGKAFTRAPIIVWQLFQIILAVSFLSSNIAMVKVGAFAAIAIAGVSVVLLFAPKTTAFLGDRPAS